MLTEAVGWTAAILLLVTRVRQVWSQWNSGSVAGISRWLFVGQVAASVGFTAYSLMLGNFVFAFTNGLLTINAIAGLLIDRRNRRRQAERKRGGAADPDAAVAPAPPLESPAARP